MNQQAERERVSSRAEFSEVLRDLRYGRVIALRSKQPLTDGANNCIVEVKGESGSTAVLTLTLYAEKGILITAADGVDYFGKELAWKPVNPERATSLDGGLIDDWAELGRALKLEEFVRMRALTRWLFLLANK